MSLVLIIGFLFLVLTALMLSRRPPGRRGALRRRFAAGKRASDADFYREAVEAALGAWRAGRLPQLTAVRLGELIESHYWKVAPGARRSGAGYVLKRALAAPDAGQRRREGDRDHGSYAEPAVKAVG